MKYCTKDDIRDQLLIEKLSEADMDEADDYIEDLAQSLNVSPDDIAVPTPSRVRTLAALVACMVCARNLAAMNTRGADGDDAYSLKYKIYRGEVERLERKITDEILLGAKRTKSNYFPRAIKMERA